MFTCVLVTIRSPNTHGERGRHRGEYGEELEAGELAPVLRVQESLHGEQLQVALVWPVASVQCGDQW